MSRFVKNWAPAIIILATVSVLAGCSSGLVTGPEAKTSPTSSGSSYQPRNGWGQSHTGGAVTIDVKWLRANDDYIIFGVAMNTHSVDLDQYNLKELSVLRDDSGNEYLPLSWDAAAGGHHRRGNLTVPLPDSVRQGQAKYVQLVLRGIAGIGERVLTWEL